MSTSYKDHWFYADALSKALKATNSMAINGAVAHLTMQIKEGRNIFVCGNGGSAAIAEHLACDCSKGIHGDTGLNPRIHSLVSNTSLLTAIANDVSYDEVFAYQLRMLGQKGDTLIVISSSGESANIIQAVIEARKIGMGVISISGFNHKNNLYGRTQFRIHIPSDNYGIVEDASQAIMHYIAQAIRRQERKENLEENEIRY